MNVITYRRCWLRWLSLGLSAQVDGWSSGLLLQADCAASSRDATQRRSAIRLSGSDLDMMRSCYATLWQADIVPSVTTREADFRKPWRRKFISSLQVHLEGIRVTFIYESRRIKIKIKVTGVKTGEIPYSRNNSGPVEDRTVKFACIMRSSDMAYRMAWPPSLSRDCKWPRLTT